MKEIKGNLYKANSSACEPVTIELSDADIVLRFADRADTQSIPLDRVELSSGGFDGKRIFIKDTADGTTVITDNHQLLSDLEKMHALAVVHDQIKAARSSMAEMPKREGRHWLIFLLVIAAIGIGIYLSVDAFVDMALTHIPARFETMIGDHVLKNYREQHVLEESGPEVERVRGIVDRLVRHVGATVPNAQTYPYKVYVERTDDVNAFAMPGGNVIVLTGLLDRAKNDSEVAGVLGHEIGHVVRRHTLRSTLHRVGLIACINLLFQGQGAEEAVWLSRLVNLDDLRFSRDDEADADKVGVRLAAAADYDPNGIVSFFEKVIQMRTGAGKLLDSKSFEFISSHPCTPDRIKHMQAEIAAMEKERTP